MLHLRGLWERRICTGVILEEREGERRLEGPREAPRQALGRRGGCRREITKDGSMKSYFYQ